MSDVASKTLQVMSEIERRSLCFSKHLEVYREHGMPWMATALQRLPMAMKGGLLLNTLTFISCVALVQNGAYIDFVNLKDLCQQMSLGGVSQARLQQLLIQEKIHPGQSEESEDLEPASDRPLQGTHCLVSFRSS